MSCTRCGGNDFYLDGGFYFCRECQFQQERKTEVVTDFFADRSTFVKKQKIRKIKSTEGTSTASQITGWTSWEKYNFILIGLTNELIHLGVNPDIKLIVVQLWARYLKKLEIAFTSKIHKTMPKFSRGYKKRDVEIIYGRIRRRLRKKRKLKSKCSSVTESAVGSSSILSSSVVTDSCKRTLSKNQRNLIHADYQRFTASTGSQDSCSTLTSNSRSSANSRGSMRRLVVSYNKYAKLENERVKVLASKNHKKKRKHYEENFMSSQYKTGPHNPTPMKLLSIIYLALRIIDEKIYVDDLLRYIREGHLSYFKLYNLFPADVELSRIDIDNLSIKCDISHSNLLKVIAGVAKFIDVWSFPAPDLADLVQRYCQELQLPHGISLYTKRMIAMSPPVFNFTKKDTYFPSYEARTVSFIIVVMKLLFGLDGITEYENSRVIKIISSAAEKKELLDSKLFNFCEWQEYIECRRTVVINEHFPTKYFYDPNSKENSHFYIKFLESQPTRFEDNEEPENKCHMRLIKKELSDQIKKRIEELNDCSPSLPDIQTFLPSVTPLHSYLNQLLSDESKSLPSILHSDFVSSKVGYMMKPELLQGLARECDMELDVKDQPAHFVEKIVKTFKPPAAPNLRDIQKNPDHNDMVTVVIPEYTTTIRVKSHDPSEYLHQIYTGKIVIDSKRQRLFNKTQVSKAKEIPENQQNNNLFDQVLDNGKLNIPNCDNLDFDSMHRNEKLWNIMLTDFEGLTLRKREIDNPLDKPAKLRYKFKRDGTGKFIPRSGETSDEADNYEEEEEEEELIRDEEVIKIVDDNEKEEIKIIEDDGKKETDDDIKIVLDNSDDILIVEENLNSSKNEEETYERLILFRPFKDYWIHRISHTSHINSSNFNLLQRDLPINFRWLLNECSQMIEMNVEELYKELCFVESYYADVLSSSDNLSNAKKYNSSEYKSEIHKKKVKTKWKGEE